MSNQYYKSLVQTQDVNIIKKYLNLNIEKLNEYKWRSESYGLH